MSKASRALFVAFLLYLNLYNELNLSQYVFLTEDKYMPKNYLKEGKYGSYNIHSISYNAASVIVVALSMIGDQANENAINDLQFGCKIICAHGAETQEEGLPI